jgi:hypothetical protein
MWTGARPIFTKLLQSRPWTLRKAYALQHTILYFTFYIPFVQNSRCFIVMKQTSETFYFVFILFFKVESYIIFSIPEIVRAFLDRRPLLSSLQTGIFPLLSALDQTVSTSLRTPPCWLHSLLVLPTEKIQWNMYR